MALMENTSASSGVLTYRRRPENRRVERNHQTEERKMKTVDKLIMKLIYR